jgi:pimeloyl-ACP methyl ester carboxylesterase
MTADHPVFFSAGSETLFGVLTHPSGVPHGGLCAVILAGGGYTVTSHYNRVNYDLGRSLVAQGGAVFRFSYHGVENSSGRLEATRLDRPFLTDLGGALTWLRGRGYTGFVLIGSCFGARTALSGYPHEADVRGLVLIAPSTHDHDRLEAGAEVLVSEASNRELLSRALRSFRLRDLADAGRRRQYGRFIRAKAKALRRRAGGALGRPDHLALHGATESFLQPLEEAVRRRTPVLFVYGTTDWFGTEFRRALERGRLADLVHRASGLIEVAEVEGNVHGLSRLVVQAEVRSLIAGWYGRRFAGSFDPAGASFQ